MGGARSEKRAPLKKEGRALEILKGVAKSEAVFWISKEIASGAMKLVKAKLQTKQFSKASCGWVSSVFEWCS